jgi:hypothetical protein
VASPAEAVFGEYAVSIIGLNQLLGEAVVSDQFRAGLLNGRRAELVSDPRFKLEPDETAALLSIEADNLQDFAVGVELYLNQRKAAQATSNHISSTHPQPRWPILVVSGANHRPS